MRKIVTAMAVVLLLCSAVFAQQKLKVVVAAAGAGPQNKPNAMKILEAHVQKAFVNDGRYIAITRDEAVLNQIDKEQAYQRSGAVDDRQIAEIGRIAGAKYICTVKSTQVGVGSTFVLEASLVDIETAAVIGAGSTPCAFVSLNDLTAAGGELVRQLMNPNSVGGYGSGLYWDRSRGFAGNSNPVAAELAKILTQKVNVSEGTCVSGIKISLESDGEPSCSESMLGVTCKLNTALTITQCQGDQKTVLRGTLTGVDKASKDAALSQVMRKAEKADFWNAWVKELEARGKK
jgi:hypothetical protein